MLVSWKAHPFWDVNVMISVLLREKCILSFNKSCKRLLTTFVENGRLYNFVDGEKDFPADSNKGRMDILNPATHDILTQMIGSEAKEVDKAILSSKTAFSEWSQVF